MVLGHLICYDQSDDRSRLYFKVDVHLDLASVHMPFSHTRPDR